MPTRRRPRRPACELCFYEVAAGSDTIELVEGADAAQAKCCLAVKASTLCDQARRGEILAARPGNGRWVFLLHATGAAAGLPVRPPPCAHAASASATEVTTGHGRPVAARATSGAHLANAKHPI